MRGRPFLPGPSHVFALVVLGTQVGCQDGSGSPDGAVPTDAGDDGGAALDSAALDSNHTDGETTDALPPNHGWRNVTGCKVNGPYNVTSRSGDLVWDSKRKLHTLVDGRTWGEGGALPYPTIWDWNGTSWSVRLDCDGSAPDPRERDRSVHAAFDDARGMVVMIESRPSGVVAVWEWEPGTGHWSRVSPEPPPPTWPAELRAGSASYDPVHKRVLVTGFNVGEGPNLVTVWSWDPEAATWTNVWRDDESIPEIPNAPYWAWSIDRSRGVLVAVGALDDEPTHTLELDEAVGHFVDQTPAPLAMDWPTGRPSALSPTDDGTVYLRTVGGLWAWNVPDGTLLALAGATPEVPLGPMAVDPAGEGLLLVGGTENVQTWRWSKAGAWMDISLPASADVVRPQWASGLGLAWDAMRKRMLGVQFYPTARVWTWSPSTGWAQLTPSTSAPPPGAETPSIVHDVKRDAIVAFYSKGLWEFDLTTNAWAERSLADGPKAHDLISAVYDEHRERVLVFGGRDQDWVDSREIWEWDGTTGTWANRTTAASPPGSSPWARSKCVWAYDPASHKTYLFGYEGDLWAWDGDAGTWTFLVPSPLPKAWPEAHTKVTGGIDAKRRKLIIFGFMNDEQISDTQEYDLDTGAWVDGSTVGRPPYAGLGESANPLVYDDIDGSLLLAGASLARLTPSMWRWYGP